MTHSPEIPGWVAFDAERLVNKVQHALALRDGTIAELRAERVKLQDENESLRHDLHRVQTELDEATVLTPTGSATLDEMAETLRPVKTEADIAALAERLARVEERTAPHGGPESEIAYLHKRIDGVAEIIGVRVGDLAETIGKQGLEIAALEKLAKDRGERLDSLEERQHQDDLDRAAGEGMAEPPERSDGGPETDDLPSFEEALRAPPRLRVAVNLGKDYGVGDWVRVGPCRSAGGHRDVMAGWYPVVGITAAQHNGPSAQVQLDLSQTPIPQLVWIADRCVIDASPTRPTAE